MNENEIKIEKESKVEIVNDGNKKEKIKKESVTINRGNLKKGFIAVLIIAALIIGYKFIKNLGNDNIKDVDRILKEKYYDIKCLDIYCNQIVAYKGDKNGKHSVTLLNGRGKEVASYKETYNAKAKETKEPYAIADNYFIYKLVNTSNKETKGYSIANKKGKEVYKTDNELKVLTNYLVIENDKSKGINAYSILNNKGKVLINNVNDFRVYADKKIVFLEVDGTKEIVDEEGEIIKTDYSVVREVTNDKGKAIYLILKDSKNNSYNFFSIDKGKVVGDGFQNYEVNEDYTLTVSKKENSQVVKYKVNLKGKQTRIGVDKTQSQIASEIKKSIDENKYSVYSTSLSSSDQKYVFADDIENKAFGVYNIKKKEFTKIFDYKAEATNIYATLYLLTNEKNNNYYQISCDANACGTSKFFVYDLDNAKELYKTEGGDAIIQNYYQYTNDYKVVKYTYSSANEEYKGKYVLLDKENKEIAKSNNGIVVLNEELLIGKELTTSILIYSSKSNKMLNNDENLANMFKINEEKLYKYNSKDKVILVNSKGKELLNISSSLQLIYSDRLIVYVDEKNAVNILNVKNSKVKKYKLKENEKMNNASGDLLPPYRGVLFVNNSSDNYIKIVNTNGRVIEKIKHAEIQGLYSNSDNNVIIITKKDTGKNNLYGLYIAE